MSATLHELRTDLLTAREAYGRRSSQAERAFSDLCRAAAENGTPLDGLRHHTVNEVERFFSWTIPGLGGHVYWDGPKRFFRNDGMTRAPLRWWWQHRYGNLDNSDDLVVKCGEANCINPEHASKERIRGTALRYTDQALLGALQVLAGRIGRTPSTSDWVKAGNAPSRWVFEKRFGSWGNAVAAAGLPAARNPYAKTSPATVIAGIRFVRRELGHWPTWDEYPTVADKLREAGLPTSIHAAMRLYGSWPKARQAAGDPNPMPTDRETLTFAPDRQECDKGHLLEGGNLEIVTNGRKRCTTCKRRRWRETRARREQARRGAGGREDTQATKGQAN